MSVKNLVSFLLTAATKNADQLPSVFQVFCCSVLSAFHVHEDRFPIVPLNTQKCHFYARILFFLD